MLLDGERVAASRGRGRAHGCGEQATGRRIGGASASASRYVVIDDAEPVLPLEEALVLLAQAEEARVEADANLEAVLAQLGFEEWRST